MARISTVLEPETTVKQTRNTRAARPPGQQTAPKEIDYSRFKLSFRNTDEFARYLAGYPDKSGILAYFYRLKPKINLSLIGQPESTLLKTPNTAEMNADFCSARWGNGTYMLTLNDANRAKGQQEVARTWFTVDEPDLQAIYDPRALLLNDPANADEVARLLQSGVLVRDSVTGFPRVRTEGGPAPGYPVPVSGVVAAAAPAPSESLSAIMLTKLVDRAFPSFAPPVSAAEQIETSFKIADRFRGAPAAETPSVDQVADAVVLRLKATGTAPAVEDPFVTYERIDGVLERIGAGRKGGESGGGWVDALSKILFPLVAPLVPMVGQWLQAKTTAANTSVIASQRPLMPPPQFPAPGYQNSPPIAPIAPESPATVDKSPLDLSRVVSIAVLALDKQAAGVAGFDFASWLVSFESQGLELFRFLETKGVDGVTGLMAMVPATSGALLDPVRRAAFESWLQDFFSYNPDGSADSGEEAAA